MQTTMVIVGVTDALTLQRFFGELHMNNHVGRVVSRRGAMAAALAWGLIAGVSVPAGATDRHTPIVKAVAKARPAVVSIQGRKRIQSSTSLVGTQGGRQVKGMGTGVIVDSRGYVLTNHHVIEGVERIEVTLANQQTYIAQPVARDKKTDLAIIRIEAPEPLPVIPVGTSSDLMPGETVIAVGNAYGYDHTVTSGIVSALHRPVQVSETQQYSDLIQTDASINPGNSGGPLLNIDGEMIGVNVAVRVGANGIGFAIPVNEAMDVASQLLSAESVSRLSHGVLLKTVHASSGESRVEVLGTRDGSSGELAGLERGDVVLRVGDREVSRNLDFELALIGRRAGEEVAVEIERGGERKTVSLVLKSRQRSSLPAVDSVWRDLGIQVTPVSGRVIRQMQGAYSGGLRVLRVRSGSPAQQEGVQRGDILVGMHEWETASVQDLEFVLGRNEVQGSKRVKFYILRNGRTLYGWLDMSR